MYQLFIDIYIYIHALHCFQSSYTVTVAEFQSPSGTSFRGGRQQPHQAGLMMAAKNDWHGCLTMTEVFVVQVWIKSKVSVYSRTKLEVVVHSPWRTFQSFCCKDPSSCLRWWRRDRRRDHTGGATANTTRSKKLFKKKRCSVKKRRCFGKTRCCHMLLNCNNAVQFQYYS